MEWRAGAAGTDGVFCRSVVSGYPGLEVVVEGAEGFVLLPFSGSAACAGEGEVVEEGVEGGVRFVGGVGGVGG